MSPDVCELREKKVLKNHTKRNIVLSKTIKSQALWRNRNPTVPPPNISLGKAEVSHLTFTNTLIQLIKDIVQVFKPMPHSNKGCIPMTLPIKKVEIISVFFSLAHMH